MKNKKYVDFNNAADYNDNSGYSDFIISLAEFNSRKIKDKPEEKKKSDVFGLFLRSFLMFLSSCAFCFSLYNIAGRLIDDYSQRQLYFDIVPETGVVSAIEKPTQLREPKSMLTLLDTLENGGAQEEFFPEIHIDTERFLSFNREYEKLKEQYSDVYGWVYVKGIASKKGYEVNYPIMQDRNRKNNETFYYLHRDITGKKSDSGAIFAPLEISDVFTENRNFIIYGHNMGNGMMFRAINEWLSEPVADKKNEIAENIQIEIYRNGKVYIYDVFSAYISYDYNYNEIFFSSDAEYLQFLNTIAKRNVLEKNVPYTAESLICTLATCYKSSVDERGRCVLNGILTDVIDLT